MILVRMLGSKKEGSLRRPKLAVPSLGLNFSRALLAPQGATTRSTRFRQQNRYAGLGGPYLPQINIINQMTARCISQYIVLPIASRRSPPKAGANTKPLCSIQGLNSKEFHQCNMERCTFFNLYTRLGQQKECLGSCRFHV